MPKLVNHVFNTQIYTFSSGTQITYFSGVVSLKISSNSLLLSKRKQRSDIRRRQQQSCLTYTLNKFSIMCKKWNGKWERFYTLPKYCSKHWLGSFHTKTHLHCVIPLFPETFTKSVKKGMCLSLEVLNFFFVRNLSGSLIMLFKSFSVALKSISTSKGLFP